MKIVFQEIIALKKVFRVSSFEYRFWVSISSFYFKFRFRVSIFEFDFLGFDFYFEFRFRFGTVYFFGEIILNVFKNICFWKKFWSVFSDYFLNKLSLNKISKNFYLPHVRRKCSAEQNLNKNIIWLNGFSKTI